MRASGTLRPICEMVLAIRYGLMALSMKATGKMIKLTAGEDSSMPMAMSMKVNGRTTKHME